MFQIESAIRNSCPDCVKNKTKQNKKQTKIRGKAAHYIKAKFPKIIDREI